MNPRLIVLLFVALGIAFYTASVVRGRIQTPDPALQLSATRVLAAKVYIPAGSFVRAGEHLEWVDLPEDKILPTHLLQTKVKLEEFNGAVARKGLRAGDPIITGTLVKSTEGSFMSAVLNPGMRAVSIAVNPTTGNAGFIFPGDRVDLILTHAVDTTKAGSEGKSERVHVSETFVENVRVLAIDQMIDNAENKAVLAKTVTLEVTPSQAEKVNVATDLGKISLSLRSLAAQNGSNLAEDQAPPRKPEETFTRDRDVSAVIKQSTGDLGGVTRHVTLFKGDKASESLEFKGQTQ